MTVLNLSTGPGRGRSSTLHTSSRMRSHRPQASATPATVTTCAVRAGSPVTGPLEQVLDVHPPEDRRVRQCPAVRGRR